MPQTTCYTMHVNKAVLFQFFSTAWHSKSYPCTGLDRPRGLQGFEAARVSRQSAHEGAKLSGNSTAAFTSKKGPWYSILLEAESTPGQ